MNLIKTLVKILPTLIGSISGFFVGYLSNEEKIMHFLEARWGKPDIVYSSEDGMDYFHSDIRLKDGILTLYPQLLIIREDGTTIRTLALKDYYSETNLKYKSDLNGFQVTGGSETNLNELAYEIKIRLSKKGKIVEPHFAIIMQLKYKNEKRSDYKTIFYFMQDKQVICISEDESEERAEDCSVYLKHWTEHIDTFVEDCMNAELNE